MALEYFETIIILDDRMTTEDYNAMVNHYTLYLTEELKGTIKATDKMGKKKLAYPIKIKSADHECKDGWYILFTYKTLSKNIAKLETKLREDGAVLKFLTVKREPEEIDTGEELEDTLDQNQVISEQDDCHTVTQDYFDLIFDIKEVI